MSWLGLVVLVLALYLAFKVASALLKIVLFVVMLVAAYWFAASMLGWPSVSDLIYVLGPDFGGKRIEEVVHPKHLAETAGDYVVDRATDEFIERVSPDTEATPGDEQPVPLPEEAGDRAVEPLPAPAAQPNSRDGSV